MSFATLFDAHVSWAWFGLGLLLAVLEIFAPGAFLIWIGAAAMAMGVIAALVAPSFAWSLVLFALLAAGFALLGKKVYGSASRDQGVVLNDRARGLIGRTALLETGIGAEPGRVRFDDASWRCNGPALPAGARIKVTNVAPDGATLVVEPY